MITKQRQRKVSGGGESSATDVSDDEVDVEGAKEGAACKLFDPGDIVHINASTESGFSPVSSAGNRSPDTAVVDQNCEKENLKLAILDKILQRQKETVGVVTDKSVVNGENGSEDEDPKEPEPEPEQFVDMFADSGDEGKEKSNDGVKVSESGSDIDNVKTEEMEVTVSKDDEKKTEESMEIIEPAPVIAEEKPLDDDKDDFEKTLKTLSDIRSKMESMSKEELEEALKTLPNLNDVSNALADGRTTPIHLRDIDIPLRSLTTFVHEKRALYKQVFRNVNKKEFKFMLPKYLRVSVLHLYLN